MPTSRFFIGIRIFQEKIRRNYLRSGFVIDVLACLPYDALNIFDKDKVFGTDGSGSSGYGNIFSILKVFSPTMLQYISIIYRGIAQWMKHSPVKQAAGV